MAPQELAALIATLSPDQQQAVEQFIVHLRHQQASPVTPVSFRDALDSFVREHPELLRRLAE